MKADNYDIVVAYIIENQDKFYRLAYSYVRNQDNALDIVQNAICKALENYKSIRDITYIRTWFYRILVNESMNYINKYKKEIASETIIMGETCMTEEASNREDLYQEMNRLPLLTQHIIKLRFYEELSLKEIAQITNKNINTVKAKLYRGLKILKQEVHYE